MAPAAYPRPVDIFEGLRALVDKSLVSQDDRPDRVGRFRMLETIRAYAWEQLSAAEEDDALRRQHARYYLRMVEDTGALLFATSRTQDTFAAEQGNIQTALRWLVEHG